MWSENNLKPVGHGACVQHRKCKEKINVRKSHLENLDATLQATAVEQAGLGIVLRIDIHPF